MMSWWLRPLLLLAGLSWPAAAAADGRRSSRRPSEEVRERTSRGLVPQLLPNYTEPSLPPPGEVGCNYAFMACAYR